MSNVDIEGCPVALISPMDQPYGLPIHGCVDGYSRRIIWLKVCRSNNNPIVPAYFYTNSVAEIGFAQDNLEQTQVQKTEQWHQFNVNASDYRCA